MAQMPGYLLPIPQTTLQATSPLAPPLPANYSKLARASIVAKLISLDTGLTLYFSRASFLSPPSRSERRGGARWNEANVAQASPQFIEYQQTMPEIWTYTCLWDAYDHPGGVQNDLESDYIILRTLKNRVPGLRRAHRCRWIQGKQRFTCILEDYSVPIERVSANGGAMQAYEVTITLKEVR